MWCITLVPHALPCDWSQLHPCNQHCCRVVWLCVITKICEWIGPAYSAKLWARAMSVRCVKGKVAFTLVQIKNKNKTRNLDFGGWRSHWGVKGGQSATHDSEKFTKNQEKEGKNQEKRGKIGKKRPKSGRLFHFAPPDR